MKLHFTKMHALGNDFILIEDTISISEKILMLSKILCSRRFGIGADQLLLLCHSKIADFKMRIFNPDGSEAEMCGNGIRCLAKYIWDNKVKSSKLKVKSERLTIETLAGIINLQSVGKLIKVDMGEPILDAEKIPLKISSKFKAQSSKPPLPPFAKGGRGGINSSLITHHSSLVKNFPVKIDGKIFKITCVSMGNPHVVIVVKDVQAVPLSHYGPLIEKHRLFPKKTNVEFIQILNPSNIKMRVWERGTGETMACGTGASAAGVASILLGLTRRKTIVHLPGGKLLIDWSREDNHVYMTGPATKVFDGRIEI